MTTSLETSQQPLSLSKAVPVHFIGIGGIGMSGLAKILLENGFQVSGSDLRQNQTMRELRENGASVFVGHQAENLPDGAVVIVSSAIPHENPEIQKAVANKNGIYHRSQLLREILQGEAFTQNGRHQETIGVTGTHGKTTITGMVGVALRGSGADPTIIAGGLLPGLGTNAIFGEKGKIAVAELDESDGTIVQYTPTHSIVINLELDHADHYTGGLSDVVATFQQYLSALKPGSKVYFNWSCPTTRQLFESAPDHIQPILFAPGDQFTHQEPQVTYWLKNARVWHRGCYQGYVYKKNRMLGELNMTVPGMHNLLNALASIAVGDQLGQDFDEMAAALRQFSGMGRRFERLGTLGGAWVVDDYGHHPTEVVTTLKAAKETLQNTSGAVSVVFQPHRYSRLQAFWDEFQTSFASADRVYITDVYAASEAPIPGVDSETFVKEMQEKKIHPNVTYIPRGEWESLRAQLLEVSKPQDIILSMGAGDVTGLFRGWDKLEAPQA